MASNKCQINDVQNLFSRSALWQSWLDVEAALALVQADLGMIPVDAAREIAATADISVLDTDELERDVRKTKAPVVSLTRMLAAACDGEHGRYVHWGATTQNVMQTGRILQVRKAHRITRRRLGDALAALADLATRGADMLMPGRTQRRHALPITFGFKVAGWIEEMLRHVDRFDELEPRLFSLHFGGAIGAMQSFGEYGPALNQRLAERLQLTLVTAPVRSAADHLAEYVLTMALYATTCSKIAQELYTLMSDEFGEVAEGQEATVVGSSTMPQKINSKIATNMLLLAARIRSKVTLALEGMQPSHDGDAAANQMSSAALDTVCVTVHELTDDLATLLSGLQLKPERMVENLERTNGLIVSENVMMTLAPKIGRQNAHDVVHAAADIAQRQGGNLFDLLMADETVRTNVSESDLRAALDPVNYTGCSAEIARRCAVLARITAAQLTGE